MAFPPHFLLPALPLPLPCLLIACPGEPVVALEVPIATAQHQEHPNPVNLNSLLLSISPMYNTQGTVNEVGCRRLLLLLLLLVFEMQLLPL